MGCKKKIGIERRMIEMTKALSKDHKNIIGTFNVESAGFRTQKD